MEFFVTVIVEFESTAQAKAAAALDALIGMHGSPAGIAHRFDIDLGLALRTDSLGDDDGGGVHLNDCL